MPSTALHGIPWACFRSSNTAPWPNSQPASRQAALGRIADTRGKHPRSALAQGADHRLQRTQVHRIAGNVADHRSGQADELGTDFRERLRAGVLGAEVGDGDRCAQFAQPAAWRQSLGCLLGCRIGQGDHQTSWIRQQPAQHAGQFQQLPRGDLRGLDLYENQQLAGHLRGLLDAAHPPQVTQPRSDAARYRRKKGTALDPCRRIVLVGNLLAGQRALAELDDRLQAGLHAAGHERFVQAADAAAEYYLFDEAAAGSPRFVPPSSSAASSPSSAEDLCDRCLPGLRLAAIEGELDVGHLHHVAVVEFRLLGPLAVDERAVRAAEVPDAGRASLADHGGVLAGNAVGIDLQIGRVAAPNDEGRLVEERFLRRAALGGEMFQPGQTQGIFRHELRSHIQS